VTDELRALLDRRAIEDVVLEYARAVDARDWPVLATCFTEDCLVDYALSGRAEGPDEVVTRCRTAVEWLDATQHHVTNIRVDAFGATASSVCSLAAVHVRAGRIFTFGGTYSDEWVRAGAGWRIRRRRLERRWTAGDPTVLRPDAVPREERS
jgi:ketosteroid isomerase-like protein